MTKAERLLFIVNLFRVRKAISLDELAQECEVSTRTIYRDLISLSDLNIPVYFDRGYRLSRDISLPALNFTVEEEEIVGFCLQNSPLCRSQHFRNILRNIELKILSAVPDKTRGCLCRHIVCPESPTTPLSGEVDSLIGQFMQALLHKNELCLMLKPENKVFEGLYPVSLEIRARSWQFCMTDTERTRTLSVPVDRIISLRIVGSKTD
ncbi:MAG: HTH domain-containing protein [Candidatus Zixiibacteriota bacterium]|nr:MAG: HTH domain-containing protein [candidate division Zixibacteria bacterium]